MNVIEEAHQRLKELAGNLWWTWHEEVATLFCALAGEERFAACGRKPLRLLAELPPSALTAALASPEFRQQLEDVYQRFAAQRDQSRTIAREEGGIGPTTPVAYCCMEYALDDSLPIYSGGLGVLAGDHLKSASDLGLPLVGVGLLYHKGYFVQRIDRQGCQGEIYPTLNLNLAPLTRLPGMTVRITLPGSGLTILAAVWKVSVGGVELYLLDPDLEGNPPRLRRLCDRLYGGDRRTRLLQEVLLGMGGVSLLEDHLSLRPSVWHLNEGHSAFLLLERLQRAIRRGLTLSEAKTEILSTSVFTTHTPIAAGNETFVLTLLRHYFKGMATELGLDWEAFADLGRDPSGSPNEFSMTVLALHLCRASNGVSRLHGKVARTMWQGVYGVEDPELVPIGHITNGVHVPTWLGDDFKGLLRNRLGLSLEQGAEAEPTTWNKAGNLEASTLWNTHLAQKQRLFELLGELQDQGALVPGNDKATATTVRERLDPTALTLGFARRFATYKRHCLLLLDRKRLRKLLCNPNRKVVLLFAGKAHPADEGGKAVLQQLLTVAREKEFLGRILFLQNYDMAIAKILIGGVDVWVNTPIRPLEASGTSGMKAACNAVPNLSVLDGWWDEAYANGLGWGFSNEGTKEGKRLDRLDNATLFGLLEQQILPAFFERDRDGLPMAWIELMRRNLAELPPRFSTSRMVAEYRDLLYRPCPTAPHYVPPTKGRRRGTRLSPARG